MPLKFKTETLGCKVNQFETQAIEALLLERGHTAAKEPEMPDIIIINTCAVTAESGRKSRQAIRRAKKDAPDALICICGCYSQISPDDVASLGADIVAGSADRRAFVDDIEKVIAEHRQIISVDDAMRRRTFEELPSGSLGGRTRAMLKIQDGCVNFCTYCVIPYSRGPVRSMMIDSVAAESKKLADMGYKEIVVTGIEISSFGKDLKNVKLENAVETICKNAPGVRIHLGSLEPRVVTEDFAAMCASFDNLIPHFHLSLQSGSDGVLARMHRKYDTARFFESVEILRKYYPQCGITCDLITGFPGETEKEFNETMAFIEKCAFSDMHIFPYSPRPGTPAAKMENQIHNDVKKARAARASALSARMASDFRKSLIGSTLNVLFETQDGEFSYGHSENYVSTAVKVSEIRNRVLQVTVTGAESGILQGSIFNNS